MLISEVGHLLLTFLWNLWLELFIDGFYFQQKMSLGIFYTILLDLTLIPILFGSSFSFVYQLYLRFFWKFQKMLWFLVPNSKIETTFFNLCMVYLFVCFQIKNLYLILYFF